MEEPMTVPEVEIAMRRDGWTIFSNIVQPSLLERLREDVEAAWEVCREAQVRNGVATDTDLTVHHILGIRDSFLELLEAMAPLDPFFERYFKGKYVLNSIGGAINARGHTSYAQRIHRDIRTFSGDTPLLLNTIVMLDDFTAENGATRLCSGSHRMAEKPSQPEFDRNASAVLGTAGSIVMFDSNLWHAGGTNRSASPRRSITPMFCRPFIKPQFDYPRALGYDRAPEFSEFLRQLIGYNARIPSTLGEWYKPPQERMYRNDQG